MSVHLQRELQKLDRMLLDLGTAVEENLLRAIESVESRDLSQAKTAMELGESVDRMEIDVEEECLKILALYQPVAADLRMIVSILKINSDLERVGDLAEIIARNVKAMRELPEGLLLEFGTMGDKTRAILRRSLDSFVNRDAVLAAAVLEEDKAIDKLHHTNYHAVALRIQKNPDQVENLLPCLNISRSLERIGDHATNIAEDVLYLLQGHIVRHH